MTALATIVDLDRYPLDAARFRVTCHATLAETGALVMPGFLRPAAVESVRQEGLAKRNAAYFCQQAHTVSLAPLDPDHAPDHPRNRLVTSTKGCIADDQVAADSALRQLYEAPVFRAFLCAVLGEDELYPYADSVSSINLHYAGTGQELGWHFDNSSFAVTLMIQAPEAGGAFEYVPAVRDADAGETSDDVVAAVLDGAVTPQRLDMEAGTLVLFRGRNALHRVAPVAGTCTRMLAVLAYNTAPGIALSETARMTFYGRLG